MGWKNWVVTIFILIVIIGGAFMTVHASADYRVYTVGSFGVGPNTVVVVHDIEQTNTCYVMNSYEYGNVAISCVKDNK